MHSKWQSQCSVKSATLPGPDGSQGTFEGMPDAIARVRQAVNALTVPRDGKEHTALQEYSP